MPISHYMDTRQLPIATCYYSCYYCTVCVCSISTNSCRIFNSRQDFKVSVQLCNCCTCLLPCIDEKQHCFYGLNPTHNLHWPISAFLEGWCWCGNINCKSAELIVSINSKKHLVDSLKQSKYIKQSQFGSEASGHTLDTMHRLAVVSPFNIWFIVQQKQMEVKLFTVSMNMVSCNVTIIKL